jgi:hypothetical protein
VIECPPTASVHRNLAEEPRNAGLLAEVLHEVTGCHLSLAFAVGASESAENGESEEALQTTTEEEFVSLLKDTFDAREVREDA